MSYECPFCPCVFVSKSDLERHLEVFGKRSHLRKFRRVHEELEFEVFREHGGADRQVRILARFIEGMKR